MSEIYFLNKYKGLGTYWYIKTRDLLIDTKIVEITNYLKNELRIFEDLYSRFLPNSELSILNKNKVLINPSTDLIKMIDLSLKFNELTHNYFNIASGGELEKLGYTGDFDFSKKGKRQQLPYLSKIISLENTKISIDANFNIDLGGIGKSYLIKKIANVLKDNYQLKEFTINAGGDIYTSFKENIYIQNPINLSKYLKMIEVENCGIATSSPILRSWSVDGKKQHHLINPNRESFEINFLSCTVVSEDIIHSDIWSKVILISNGEIAIPLNDVQVFLIDTNFDVISLA